MDDLNIAIGNLGNYSLLAGCLRSIFAEDAPGFRFTVTVVFNAPAGVDTYQCIERDFPQVKLIRRAGPLGYCGTYNLVLNDKGDSRYVLVLDDDTIVPKGTLPRIVAFMDQHRDVGIAGCKTLNADGGFQRTFGLVPSLRSELVNAFRADSFWPDRLYKDLSSVREVEWLNGSFMLVRREALQAVGGLDEHYYTYVCEPDWCYRIHKAGFKVVFVPDIEIIHVGGEHSINNKMKATKRLNLVRYHVNRFYFFHKHYGAFATFLLRPIMIAGTAARAVLYAGLYVMKPELREMARAKLQSYVDVVRLSLSPRPYVLPARLQPPIAARTSPRVAC
jgi:GT2 family glycosyltransferase